MATKNKTTVTNVSVTDFINSFVDKEEKRHDSFRLVELMQQWSGFEPKMWGPTIIGFGSFHYKYASGREGMHPLLAFHQERLSFLYMLLLPVTTIRTSLTSWENIKWAKLAFTSKS